MQVHQLYEKLTLIKPEWSSVKIICYEICIMVYLVVGEIPEGFFDEGFQELHLIDVFDSDGFVDVRADNFHNLVINFLLRNLEPMTLNQCLKI